MFSTVAFAVCIAFFAEQIATTSAACQPGWIQGTAGAANAPCYLLIPGTTTQGQARLFCTSLTDTAGNIPCNLGWPESMADLNMINTRATLARTYWIGITRSAGAWVTPAAVPAVPGVLNWRRGQPDGCCGRNVSCVIAGYRGLPGGMWDDTSCETIPRGLDGYLCRTR